MKNIKRLVLVIGLCVLMTVSLGTVMLFSGCSPESQILEGTYYADVNGQEYTVRFEESGFAFSLSVAGDDRSGSYFYDGRDVRLSFSDPREELIATFDDGNLLLTYGGTAYVMLPRIAFTVTYDLDGGTGTASAQVINGRLAQRPADPVKTGFVFTGWYADSSYNRLFEFDSVAITANVTVYAQFLQRQAEGEFLVSFDTGASGTAIPSVETVGGRVYNLPELDDLSGRAFLGWWMSDYQDGARLTARVENGQELTASTTLFAVWADSLPAVSVTSSRVSWTAVGTNTSYRLTIATAAGETVFERSVSATSYTYNFGSADPGDYVVTVAVNSGSAAAYFRNKTLARVSLFEVEGSLLVFNEVENAEYYVVTYECGTSGHTHVGVRTEGTTFDFSECDMIPGGISFRVEAFAEGYASSTSDAFVFERHLETVSGLAVNGSDLLTWTAAEHAESYRVEITAGGNTQSFTVDGTSFDLQSYYGALTLKVVPVAFGYNSPEAAELTYDKTRLATPGNIRTQGDEIVWDAVTDAAGYVVTIGNRTFNTTEARLALTEEDLAAADADFEVTVQAIAAASSDNSFISAAATISRELSGLAYANGGISWNPVFGVSTYGVRVNGGEVFTVEDAVSTAITLTQAGSNTVEVCFYVGGEETGWVAITVNADVTITFNKNTGEGSDTVQAFFAAGDPLILPAADDGISNRIGYTLQGWAAEGGQNAEQGTAVSASATYFARWQANTYTVTLSVPASEGYFGSSSQRVQTVEVEVTFGSPFTLDIPACLDGAEVFGGWYSEFGGVGTAFTGPTGESYINWNIASDTTLHPGWLEAFTYALIADPDNPAASAYSVSAGPGINYLAEVTVPALYEGLRVARIEGNCFNGCANLQVVNIPDSISSVYTGDSGANSTGSAFHNCASLRAVNVYDASASFTNNYRKLYSSVDGVLIYDNPYGGVELAYFPIARTGEYTLPDTVTTIPLQAFRSTKVSVINVPASVTSVGYRAFYSSSIQAVNFLPAPEGETAGALTIGEQAFYFSGVTSITLPARLESLDVNIFTYCRSLTAVHIEEGENNVYTSTEDGVILSDGGRTLFYFPLGKGGSYTIPANVSVIGERAFYDCDNLTAVVIPAFVTSIGAEAFRTCGQLASVTFQGQPGDPELTIGELAFYQCSALTTLTLPANLKVLGANAFGGIAGLTTVTVNTAIEDIEYNNGAFATTGGITYVTTLILGPSVNVFDIQGVFGAANLTSVQVDENNPYYEEVDGVLFDKDITRLVYYPNARGGDYTVPDTVTTIGANVFLGNIRLTGITFGSGLTVIGESAFRGATGLTRVTFTSGTAELEIGARAFYGCTGLTTVTLPSNLVSIGDEAFVYCTQLTEIVVPEGVRTIGHAAFYYCIRLTSASLPSTLESLGTYSAAYDYLDLSFSSTNSPSSLAADGIDNIDVFDNCIRLSTITIPETNAFYGVVDNVIYGKDAGTGALTILYFSPLSNAVADGEVSIPATVVEIKDRAFYGNTAVTSVVFEDRTESGTLTVGEAAFQNCTALASVDLPAGLTEIPDRMFVSASIQEIFIPNTVTRIGEAAFYRCADLTTVVFEEGGTQPLVIADGTRESSGYGSGFIEYYYGAFAGCTSLLGIALPERTTEIGDYAFYYSTYTTGSSSSYGGGSGLQNVTLPSTLTRVGTYAFAGTPSLVSVTFANGGEAALTLEDRAFYNSAVTSIVLPDNLSVIEQYAFYSTDLTSLHIPVGVTEIGDSAFSSCTALTEVTVAEGSLLTEIGVSAFSGARAMTAFELGKCASLTAIGNTAFQNCSALAAIDIPASVKTIGQNAFNGCTSLAAVNFLTAAVAEGEGTVQRASLTEVGSNAFRSTALTSFAFPESTSNITLGDYLFQSCRSLTTVHLSTSVVDIGSALARCMSIDTITVAEGSQNFKGHESQPLLLNVDGNAIIYAFGPVTSEEEGGVYTIPEGFVTIGPSAFFGQNGIRVLNIPASVTSIGESAFRYCRGLEAVNFASGSLLNTIGEYAFAYCFSLKSVTLPEGLVAVGANAFYGDASLAEAVLPSTLTYFGNYAFGYTGLIRVNVPNITIGSYNGVTYNAQNIFSYSQSLSEVTFNSDATVIAPGMFRYCDGLTSITFPAGLETISATSTTYAPFAYSGLAHVDLNGLTEIPQYTFWHAEALTDIDLSAVTSIGNYAFTYSGLVTANLSNANTLGTYVFQNSASLTTVTLSDALVSLSNYAFSGCSSLTTVYVFRAITNETVGTEGTVTLPSALSSIGRNAFAGSGIIAVEIPLGVTRLTTSTSNNSASATYGEMFSGCEKLEKVILPETLTVIGHSTFRTCAALKTVQVRQADNTLLGEEGTVTLPEGLTILGNYAFAESGIEQAAVPASVAYIGSYAFQDCTALTYAELRTAAGKYGTGSTAYAINLFDGCTSLVRVVLNNAMTAMGASFFNGCTSLTTVDLYNAEDGTVSQNEPGVVSLPAALAYIGNYAFYQTAIREVTIPVGVKMLSAAVTATSTNSGSPVFRDCVNLEKVVLHNSGFTRLGASTFRGCTSLKTIQYVDVTNGNAIVGEEGAITLPGTLTLIGEYAFEGSSIEKVIVPASVTLMGRYVFQDCTALTYAEYLTTCVKYSSSATAYSTYLFDGCTALETVVLNSAITYLPGYTFRNCSSLTTVRLYNTAAAEGEDPYIGEVGAVTLPAGVTVIGTYAFYGCASIADVTMPEALTEIGNYAFYGCSSIAGVTLPGTLTKIGNSVFRGCGALTELTLPEGLTEIGSDAFLNTGISEMTLPASVTSIGNNAFCNIAVTVANGSAGYFAQDGVLLTTDGVIVNVPSSYSGEYVVPASVTAIGGYALNGCNDLTKVTVSTDQLTSYSFAYFRGEVVVTLGESTVIPSRAFQYYAGTSVTLPEGVTELGDYVFANTSALTSVTLPESLTKIGGYLFYNASAIADVTIPACVTEVGAQLFRSSSVQTVTFLGAITDLSGTHMFAYAEQLTTVTLPATVTEMGNYFFAGCISLTTVRLYDPAAAEGEDPYSGADNTVTLPENLQSVGTYFLQDCVSVEAVVIPSLTSGGGTSQASSMFSGCTALKSVELGDKVTAIPGHMFRDKTELTSITLPASVTTIGTYAFANTGLTSITLPASLTTVGTYAFAGCTALQTVYLPASLTALGNYMFGPYEIEDEVFVYCTALSTICTYTPDENGGMVLAHEAVAGTADLSAVATIGTYVFNGCTALEQVIFSDVLTKIDDYAFSASGLKSVTLPGSLVGSSAIDSYSFAACPNLESVVFEDGITCIYSNAFANNTALKSVTLPSTLTELRNVFANCTAIERIVIPAGVVTVNNGAFTGWTAEQTVVIEAYAVDAECTWHNSCFLNSSVKIEVVVLYEYGEEVLPEEEEAA